MRGGAVGQPENEGAPDPDLAVECDAATMAFEDLAGYGQPQPVTVRDDRRRDAPEPVEDPFLASRRARLTPEQAGLPAYGGNRRVKGLRREEVAMLAGVSVDLLRPDGARQPVRCLGERARGAGLGTPLAEAERDHLLALARESGSSRSRPRRKPANTVRPVLQQVLDAITDAPAWIRNGRHDILAMNQLARALYAPVLADPARPANTTRFVYLEPEAAERFFVDYNQIARASWAVLGRSMRSPTGRIGGRCYPDEERGVTVWPPHCSGATSIRVWLSTH